MTRVIDIIIFALFMLVGIWVLTFGSLGFTISHRARFSRIVGVLVGVALGPIGIIWMLIRTRRTPIDTEPNRLTQHDQQLEGTQGESPL
jgi:uncharacterized membrane protein YqjE